MLARVEPRQNYIESRYVLMWATFPSCGATHVYSTNLTCGMVTRVYYMTTRGILTPSRMQPTPNSHAWKHTLA